MLRIIVALWASITTCETLSRIESADWRDQMLIAVNGIRAQNNLVLLGRNGKLEKAAQKHAEYMARAKNMSHVGFNKSTMLHRIELEAYKVLSVAENVAAGQMTVAQVMEDWKNSHGHFVNIIGDYRCVGFGVKTGKDGKAYWCQDFGKSDVDTCETPGESADEWESPPSRLRPLPNNHLPPIKSPPPQELYPYSPRESSPPVVSIWVPKMPSPPPITPSPLSPLKPSLFPDLVIPVPSLVQDILVDLRQPLNFEKVPAVPVRTERSDGGQYFKSSEYDNENQTPVENVEAAEYEKSSSQPPSQPAVSIVPPKSDRMNEFDSGRTHC
uniref:SCPlike extracellular protein putative n=1 Tax=Albugo laibachii Nc14 TaxID=890382 RepID=F0WUT1_9STRA|nr:SCPlike extracellular protein putative [Albugo laibachii Nc14]|eukprot:CCA25167.1 SCPlike extracellular protein putative [Albugo laibachii Nc14]